MLAIIFFVVLIALQFIVLPKLASRAKLANPSKIAAVILANVLFVFGVVSFFAVNEYLGLFVMFISYGYLPFICDTGRTANGDGLQRNR